MHETHEKNESKLSGKEAIAILNGLYEECHKAKPQEQKVQSVLEQIRGAGLTIEGWKIYALFYYNLFLELFKSSIDAVESRRDVSAAILLRSMYEYYIEFKWINLDPIDRCEQKQKMSEKAKLKRLNIADNSQSPFFKNSIPKISGELEKKVNEKKEIVGDFNGSSLESMCKNIDSMLSLDIYYNCYTVFYRHLSEYIHPNLNRMSNHFIKDDSWRWIKSHLVYICNMIDDFKKDFEELWKDK